MAVRRRGSAAVLSSAILAVSSAGCGASSAADADAAVTVVTATDVYGDIVAQIAGRLAGNRVAVKPVISDPAVDPHSYEATTRTELAVSRADLIIENGGGYDDFLDTMRRSAGKRGAIVINVVKLSGRRAPAKGDLNEHVWYDLPSVAKLVHRVVAVLSEKDAPDAATFRANGDGFRATLDGLERVEATIKEEHAGAGVAITEPVPLYLLDACGLVNRTPPQLSRAIEEGTDVSPRILHQTLALFGHHRVQLLADNAQTSSPVSTKMIAAAKAQHIAVVPVTETLPEHTHYLAWMGRILAAVRTALTPPRS
jgi:zinc/manganese transport system substrate-binding protein